MGTFSASALWTCVRMQLHIASALPEAPGVQRTGMMALSGTCAWLSLQREAEYGISNCIARGLKTCADMFCLHPNDLLMPCDLC